jgi:hypothetical protein
MNLQDLGAAQLGRAARESGIRWKVIVVSACQRQSSIRSGRLPLVITAAPQRPRSFGCAATTTSLTSATVLQRRCLCVVEAPAAPSSW